MINPNYNLPKINFIGGESRSIIFNILTKTGKYYDATGCDMKFSIISHSNKNGQPLVVKNVQTQKNNMGIANVAVVNLDPEDTSHLYGRYVYQLSIRDIIDEIEIPGQGIIDIGRNIHQSFIS